MHNVMDHTNLKKNNNNNNLKPSLTLTSHLRPVNFTVFNTNRVTAAANGIHLYFITQTSNEVCEVWGHCYIIFCILVISSPLATNINTSSLHSSTPNFSVGVLCSSVFFP